MYSLKVFDFILFNTCMFMSSFILDDNIVTLLVCKDSQSIKIFQNQHLYSIQIIPGTAESRRYHRL